MLQAACLNKYITTDQVQRMIDMGADVNAVSAKTGLTPLHYAAMHKKPGLAKIYLENGADPNLKNQGGETPLEVMEKLAARFNQSEENKKKMEEIRTLFSAYDVR